LAQLILRFGERDERMMDTARPYELLAGFDQPISVRVYKVSAGYAINLQDIKTRRTRPRLELRNLGDRVSDEIAVPTGCGDFTYAFAGALVEAGQVRVSLTLDRDAARNAVSRAVSLNRCL
jgi:hypothetical protein